MNLLLFEVKQDHSAPARYSILKQIIISVKRLHYGKKKGEKLIFWFYIVFVLILRHILFQRYLSL